MTSEVETLLNAQEIKMGTEKLREIGVSDHNIVPDENGQIKLSNQSAFEKTEVSQETPVPVQEAPAVTAPVQETHAATAVEATVEAQQTPVLENPVAQVETATTLQASIPPSEENIVTAPVVDATVAEPAPSTSIQTEIPKSDLEVSAVEAATEIMNATKDASQDTSEVIESIDYNRSDTLTEPAVSVSDPNELASLDFGPKEKEELPVLDEKKEEIKQTETVDLPPMPEKIIAQEPTEEINTALFETNVGQPTAESTQTQEATVSAPVLESTMNVVPPVTESQPVEANAENQNLVVPTSDMVVADNPFIAPSTESTVESAIDNAPENMDANLQPQSPEVQTPVESTLPSDEPVKEVEIVTESKEETPVSVFEQLDKEEKVDDTVPTLDSASNTNVADSPELSLPNIDSPSESNIVDKLDKILNEVSEIKEMILSKQDLAAIADDKSFDQEDKVIDSVVDLPTLDSLTTPELNNPTITPSTPTIDQNIQPAPALTDSAPVDDNMIMGGKFL